MMGTFLLSIMPHPLLLVHRLQRTLVPHLSNHFDI